MEQNAQFAHRNRLAISTSPYLRQHATNPVDWYEWGEEALSRARSENKPILLSVGYSACHWCHVMAHESFEDPAIAALMNEHYINIKVDREERPDLDAIYQKVVQLQGGGGGWPLTVFLTPEQEPFFGGTYFPPHPMHGRPSFKQVLVTLARLYAQNFHDVEQQVAMFRDGLRSLAALVDTDRKHRSDLPSLTEPEAVEAAVQHMLRRVDPQWGGFGSAPKFPNGAALEVLLQHARHPETTAHAPAASAALRSVLDHMARGGIYDHLRGGFARYSTDRMWLVPHFEKMLYDNAQLLPLYAEAAAFWPDEHELWRVVTETVGYLEADMRSADGRFYASTDADSEGVEGKYFCWTPQEVRAVLADDELAHLFCVVYDVTDTGNFEHGWSIPHLPRALSERAQRMNISERALQDRLRHARERLLEHRYTRIPPHRDDKLITSWNALLVSGLARAAIAGAVKGETDAASHFVRLATQACEQLVTLHTSGVVEARPGEKAVVYRAAFEGKVHTRGYLDDVAYLARACLDLHTVTLAPVWMQRAQRLAEHGLDHYVNERGDGFYFTADDGERLIERPESQQDGPSPSGLAVIVEVLLRLDAAHVAEPTGQSRGRDIALRVLERYRSASAEPLAFASLLTAASHAQEHARHVELSGPSAEALLPWAARVWPFMLRAPERTTLSFHETQGQPMAILCRGQTCSAPLEDAEELVAELSV